DLHLRFVGFRGVTFAGLEGSMLYNQGAVQYTDGEMTLFVLRMMPRMLFNRARRGFGVHVMVVHSPPRGIHDIPEDRAHRGFRTFLWLMRWARPQYLIHGHVDTWDRRKTRETQFAQTQVININPVMVLDV
ncbi:MAG: metallophosphoesterase, partial [Anaerolineae bacterium]|nr:metallophosphoesterase [Anaerolineae bacterium]